MPSIHESIAQAAERLSHGPHRERARQDAEALLGSVLGRNKAWLIGHAREELPESAIPQLAEWVERRSFGEPIQYIIGETEFYRMPFHVNHDVLIPRPETEILVEKALELARVFRPVRILDVGTGSGAIAVALAHERPDAVVAATDLSASSLEMARANAGRNGVSGRIRFLEGDLLAPVAGEQFEIIVSNPPYVAAADSGKLAVEVRDYEPAQALFAGADGLAIHRRLIPEAWEALVPGGFLILEIGYEQQPAVKTILADAGFDEIEFTPDLQGIPRVASARRP